MGRRGPLLPGWISGSGSCRRCGARGSDSPSHPAAPAAAPLHPPPHPSSAAARRSAHAPSPAIVGLSNSLDLKWPSGHDDDAAPKELDEPGGGGLKPRWSRGGDLAAWDLVCGALSYREIGILWWLRCIARLCSYVDVVVQTRSGKAVRVVVELSFRAEFEVARASAGYRALVTALPEVFVGRADRLRAVIKVMCAAGKQCMKENSMHMGPWRKHKYMQSKWLGAHERTTAAAAVATPAVPAVVTVGSSEKQTKFRASMLSFDFARTAVEVV